MDLNKINRKNEIIIEGFSHKKEYPFKIKSIKAKNKKELDISWHEVKTDTGMKYEILARNTRTTSGRIKNYIKIKTDSKVKPDFQINVGGYLQNPVKPKKDSQNQ